MQLGKIGLGRMGASMMRRVRKAGQLARQCGVRGKGLSALRFEFGGHHEKRDEDGGAGE